MFFSSPRTWIEISQKAFNHNCAQYKKVIGNSLLAPVIKSNAYGHGLEQLGSLCEQSEHVDWLCTLLLSNALLLRKKGITKQILVLGLLDVDPTQAINKNIEFVIADNSTVHMLNTIGKKHGYRFGIHIKVDTGLSRLGVLVNEAPAFIEYVNTLPYLNLRGICTHFAESQKENSSFSTQQYEQFDTILKYLESNNIYVPFKHIANSAATTTLSLPLGNLYRIGIGIYGLWPLETTKKITQQKYPDFDLQPILEWKTHIAYIKTISAYSYVSYDRTYQTTRTTRIGVIPVGYDDGYDFRLSNKASVLIGTAYAPILGNVGMNMTIVDLTDIPYATIGDEVILLGNYPQINVHALGHIMGRINIREILSCICSDIPRVIINQTQPTHVIPNKNHEINRAHKKKCGFLR